MELTALPLDTPATLPLGSRVVAQVYPDDDAVAAMAWSGPYAVQVTRSGLVVLRDATTLAVTARLAAPVPAVGVTVVNGTFYLLFEDDRLARFDAAARTLDAERPLGGTLVYLGNMGGGPTAVVHAGGGRQVARFASVNLDTGATRRHHVRNGRRTGTLEWPPAAGVGDRTLYLAWDWGEFGGARYALDLATGRARRLEARGALGFTHIGGRLVAYGGLQHMGMWSSFVDGAAGQPELFAASGHEQFSLNPNRPAPGPPTPTGPDAPVTLLAASANGRVAVVAHGKIWETDPSFSSWALRAEPGLHAFAGRSFSVGVTPASTALRIADDGTITHASALDGIVTIHPDGRVTPVADRLQVGVWGGQILTVGDEVYTSWDCHLRQIGGTPTPVPVRAPEGAARCVWDTDATGALRVTARVGREIVSASAAAPDTPSRVPMPPDGEDRRYLTPAVARAGERILLGDRVGTRVWDGSTWYEVPPLAGFEGVWDRLAPVPGSPDLLREPDTGQLLRVPAPGGAWEVVASNVSDARVLTNSTLVTMREGNLTVDGCGRLWRIGATLSFEDTAGVHPVERPPGMWGWSDVAPLSDGVAVGGAGAWYTLRVPCAATAG
jgi:hypothetical protein